MTSYKEWRAQGISNAGFTTGVYITQQAFQDVSQNDIVFVAHDEEITGLRNVQVVEFNPESESTVNTSLDFDNELYIFS